MPDTKLDKDDPRYSNIVKEIEKLRDEDIKDYLKKILIICNIYGLLIEDDSIRVLFTLLTNKIKSLEVYDTFNSGIQTFSDH